VLGAGIVGTSIALHLVKRGLSVTLIDRGEPGQGTSYGNAGIIEGNTVFPAAFPASFVELARIALKRSTLANYHLRFLPKVAPWLMAFRAASQPARLVETAQIMRPLMARAVPEHDALAAESGAERHFSRRDDSCPVRARDAGGQGVVSARRAGRAAALAGRPAVLCGLPAGDRAVTGSARALARVWARSLGPDPRAGDRPVDGRNDDRRYAVLRPQALQRRAVREVSFIASFRGRPDGRLRPEPGIHIHRHPRTGTDDNPENVYEYGFRGLVLRAAPE
jgi:glycine/D-amino acid oxidase-like deaminating enzyme